MTAGAWIVPDKAFLNFFNATDLLGQASGYKAALVGSGWTPAKTTDEVWADVSANEIANGNGYTTGGLALSSVALSVSGNTLKWTSGAMVWTASGSGIPAWRRIVIYYNGTLNGKVNPIVCHMLGDSTGIDVPLVTSPNTITNTPDATDGIVKATKPA
jgi:hypothetical protein